MRETSAVLARYGDGGDVQGMLCVLGPTRMAYSRAVAMVSFIADLLNLLVADARPEGGPTRRVAPPAPTPAAEEPGD